MEIERLVGCGRDSRMFERLGENGDALGDSRFHRNFTKTQLAWDITSEMIDEHSLNKVGDTVLTLGGMKRSSSRL